MAAVLFETHQIRIFMIDQLTKENVSERKASTNCVLHKQSARNRDADWEANRF
jgi:hypothetical protein